MNKIIKYCFLVFLCSPCSAFGRSLDTLNVLKQLIQDLKSCKELSYSYNVNAYFPNGERDSLQGTMYLNAGEKLYYNDCNAFTIVYTDKWFYKADHRNKSVTIIDVNKNGSKKAKQERDKEVFQTNPMTYLLDSFVLKFATIKKYKHDGDILTVSLLFPGSKIFHQIDLVYNPVSRQVISTELELLQPWQRTPKGVQSIELRYKLSNFKQVADINAYNADQFFVNRKDKFELKKYSNYKLYKM